ncbi:VWA domain-containing protein [Verrucomicrobiales bacterium]|nr:VWA domain-containing protein [Verrucomicrobiales bacterium]
MKVTKKNLLPVLLITGFIMPIPVSAKQVNLEVAMAEPLILAEKKNTTFIKVGLTGFDFIKDGTDRAPVNVAIVLDKSGSMDGNKIIKAREAAKMAIHRLNKNDIVSVVLYDGTVQVIVPATKVSDKNAICAQIDRITANGSTALFAGVSKGAAEIRKFIDKDRVNRVLLLSDGQANIGPKSPKALGDLGGALLKDGISVSTIGLGSGYNEDLMFKLADRSDGNHAFAENENDLVRIFDAEFGEILSVVAQEVLVKIECDKDVRPVRVIGRDAEISGSNTTVLLNQLYSGQEKYIILEVEVPAGRAKTSRNIAKVELSYSNMSTNITDVLTSTVKVRFTETISEVTKNTNKEVMASCLLQIGTIENDRALALRDAGKVKEARKVLLDNGVRLQQQGKDLGSKNLSHYGKQNTIDADLLDKKNWLLNRKKMRDTQYKNLKQRGY